MKQYKTKHILLWIIGLALYGYCPTAVAHTIPLFASILTTEAMAEPSLVFITAVPNDTTRFNEGDTIIAKEFRQLEVIEAPVDTSSLYALNDSITKENKDIKLAQTQFVPDPQRALWLSLVFPGAGQIYNRKYWKLPIIYGGFLGCTYALLWNQQMYMDYSQAYLDIMDDDPNTKSYEDMLPPRYDITGQEDRFKKIFKNKKDRFRRYRDLSAFCFVGVYLISVIDAYVDAQLSEFDITPDLSLRLEPAVIQQKGLNHDRNAYGVGCSINF